MVDAIPLLKEEFPSCVRVSLDMSLLEWLENLNRLASPDPLGKADNSLSEADFTRLKNPDVFLTGDPIPSFLSKFRTFGDFRGWVAAYKKGELCSNQCENEIPPKLFSESARMDVCLPFVPPPRLVTMPAPLAGGRFLQGPDAFSLPPALRGQVSYPQEGRSPRGPAESLLYEIYREEYTRELAGRRTTDPPYLVDSSLLSKTISAARGATTEGMSHGVDLVFAVDNSGSMEIGSDFVLSQVRVTVNRLLLEGAPLVRVGLVFFSDGNDASVVLPLTPMDRATLKELPSEIAEEMNFSGGTEPVGLGAKTGLDLLRDSPGERARVLVVITDEDGLRDDEKYRVTVAEAGKEAEGLGISMVLFSAPLAMGEVRRHRLGYETSTSILEKRVLMPFKRLGSRAELVDVVRAANVGDDLSLSLRAVEELLRRGEKSEAIAAARRIASLTPKEGDPSQSDAIVRAASLLDREGDAAGRDLLRHAASLGSSPTQRQRAAEALADLDPAEGARMRLALTADRLSSLPGNISRGNGLTVDLAQFAHVVSSPEELALLLRFVEEARRRISDAGQRHSFVEFSAAYAGTHGVPKLLADREILLAQRERGLQWEGGEPFLFSPDFAVSERTVHYFVDISREEGERRLQDLALESDREEAWLYADYETDGVCYSRWFEVGTFADRSSVMISGSPLRELLTDPRVKIEAVTAYHIHTLGERADTLTAKLLSPEDVESSIGILNLLHLSGKVGEADCRVITPHGRYTLTLREMKKEGAHEAERAYALWLDQNKGRLRFEQDVLVGVAATSLLDVTYDFHSPLLAEIQERFRALWKRIDERDESDSRADIWRFWVGLAGEAIALDQALDEARNGGVSSRILAPYKALTVEVRRQAGPLWGLNR